MAENREKLMREIQSLSFAKDEAILYLDMHPDCQNALQYFKEVTEELDGLMEEYQNKYGAIYHESAARDRWSWGEGAWPWQNGKRGEK